MREGELTQLTWDMVDLPKRQIVLTPDVVSLKNDTPRIIPLSRVACDTLSVTVRHSKSRYVFWHDDGQSFVKFSNFWKGVRRRSGVQNFKFRDIRHTFASNFLNNGGDLMTLSHILGHSSVQVTERYAHLLTSTIHQQMQLVDARKSSASDYLGEQDSV